MRLSIRTLSNRDLEAADRLRAVAGWNQTPADWQRMLALAPEGCFAAEQDGQLVGTATTTSFGQSLAWIGMMLVHPSHRQQGIGGALVQHCVAHLRHCAVGCIKLDATPQGKPLYEHLGFVSEWTLTRWEHPGTSLCSLAESGGVRALESPDWPSILALDRRVIGADRNLLLAALAKNSRQVLVGHADGMVVGFGMIRDGARADYLGPVIAQPEAGPSLVITLLSNRQGRPIFWDIPDQNEPATALARQLGFTPVRPLTRMFLEENSVSSEVQAQFAIADPATG